VFILEERVHQLYSPSYLVSFTLPCSYVTSPWFDLFCFILFLNNISVFVSGLYFTYERAHAAFGL
jgi:hypothetical protein